MTSTARSRIEDLRERIRAGGAAHYYDGRDGEELSDDDQEHLLAFSKQHDLFSSEYSDDWHEKLLRHCTIMAERVGGLSDALEDRDTAEELVAYANGLNSPETQRNYRVTLRMFGTRVL